LREKSKLISSTAGLLRAVKSIQFLRMKAHPANCAKRRFMEEPRLAIYRTHCRPDVCFRRSSFAAIDTLIMANRALRGMACRALSA
jgi:hypothetical protein